MVLKKLGIQCVHTQTPKGVVEPLPFQFCFEVGLCRRHPLLCAYPQTATSDHVLRRPLGGADGLPQSGGHDEGGIRRGASRSRGKR